MSGAPPRPAHRNINRCAVPALVMNKWGAGPAARFVPVRHARSILCAVTTRKLAHHALLESTSQARWSTCSKNHVWAGHSKWLRFRAPPLYGRVTAFPCCAAASVRASRAPAYSAARGDPVARIGPAYKHTSESLRSILPSGLTGTCRVRLIGVSRCALGTGR